MDSLAGLLPWLTASLNSNSFFLQIRSRTINRYSWVMAALEILLPMILEGFLAPLVATHLGFVLCRPQEDVCLDHCWALKHIATHLVEERLMSRNEGSRG